MGLYTLQNAHLLSSEWFILPRPAEPNKSILAECRKSYQNRAARKRQAEISNGPVNLVLTARQSNAEASEVSVKI